MGPGYQLTKQAHGPLTTPFTPQRTPRLPPRSKISRFRRAHASFPPATRFKRPSRGPLPPLRRSPQTPRHATLPYPISLTRGPTDQRHHPRARTSARHISSSRVGFPSPAWEFYLYTTCSTSHSKTQNSFPVSSASIGAGGFRIWGLRRLRRSWEVEKAAADSLGSIGLMATASGDQSAGIGFFFFCLFD